MTRIAALLFVLVMVITSNAQHTKFITRNAENGGVEEYYVLDVDSKSKHGTYVRFYTPVFGGGYAIVESGNYQHGQKEGVWEYFHYNAIKKYSWNALSEKGSYVNGRKNGLWTSFYLDTVASVSSFQRYGVKKKTDSVSVAIDHRTTRLKQAGMYINDKRVGEWVGFDYQGVLAQRYNFSSGELLYDRSIADSSLYNLDRKPVFVGGAPCLHNFLINNFSYSGIFEVEKDSTFAVVSFIIDGFGNVHSPTITKSSGSKPLEKELLRLVLATQGNWLPAVKAGQKTMAYVYRIRKDIVTVKKGDRTREFRAFFRVVEQDGSYSL